MLLLNKLSLFGVCIVLFSSISAFQPQANLTTATCENFQLVSDYFGGHHQFNFTETSSNKLGFRNPENISAIYFWITAIIPRLNALAILNQSGKNRPLIILPAEVADLNFKHKRGSFRKTLAPRRYYTQSSFASIPLADQIHAICNKHSSEYFKEKLRHTESTLLRI